MLLGLSGQPMPTEVQKAHFDKHAGLCTLGVDHDEFLWDIPDSVV